MTAVAPVDAASFQNIRPRLFGIAYRVVGNRADADDIVQDAWIRWQTTDRSKVRDTAAFLATTTLRLAINLTQSARVRHTTGMSPWLPDELVDHDADPAAPAELGEAIERAALTLLESLTPGERGAYILREGFDYPHRDIGNALGLGEANTRQLVRRARKALGSERRNPVSAAQQRQLVDALRVAAQLGDLATLEQLLAADMPLSQAAALPGLGS